MDMLMTDWGSIPIPADMAILQQEWADLRFWQWKRRDALRRTWNGRLAVETEKLRLAHGGR